MVLFVVQRNLLTIKAMLLVLASNGAELFFIKLNVLKHHIDNFNGQNTSSGIIGEGTSDIAPLALAQCNPC
jgi:hypothetical protein